MAFVRKGIDIISPSDGKHYTSITQYEKALDRAGQHIMSDREYKEVREKAGDFKVEKQENYNHVHIDFNNGRVEKSRRDY